MMLVHGCSNSHHTPLAAANMHNIMTRAVMILPSQTFWESLRPKGFDLDLNVLPLLLGGLLILAVHVSSSIYIYMCVCVMFCKQCICMQKAIFVF